VRNGVGDVVKAVAESGQLHQPLTIACGTAAAKLMRP
jgi:hypothetical protein